MSTANSLTALGRCWTRVSFGLAVVLLSSTQLMQGQSTFGELVGTVHDPAGSVVPTCIVKATNKGTSATRSTVTDANGSYTLVNMEPGDYELTMEAPGFQVTRLSGITLTSRQTIRLDGHPSACYARADRERHCSRGSSD